MKYAALYRVIEVRAPEGSNQRPCITKVSVVSADIEKKTVQLLE
jgi:hypothetical protein